MKGVGDGEKLLCMICIRCSPLLTPTPSSREVPNLKTPNPKNRCRGKQRAGRFLSLELGASLELGVWNWELVAWALSFSKIEMRPCSAPAPFPEQQSQAVQHHHHRAALVSDHADCQRNAADQREAHQNHHRAERDEEVLLNHVPCAPA